MEIKELRVGNIVCPINRSTEIHMPATLVSLRVMTIGFDVEAIRLTEKAYAMELWTKYSSHDLAGIPLTDEWLQKAGFVIQEYFRRLDGFCLKKTYDGYVLIGERNSVGIEIRYVHQLQNLYYAINGTELEFSEAAIAIAGGTQ